MTERFTVEPWFTAHVGACSCIIDRMTRRRILVAGVDHEARAARRAAQENERWLRSAESKAGPATAASE